MYTSNKQRQMCVEGDPRCGVLGLETTYVTQDPLPFM